MEIYFNLIYIHAIKNKKGVFSNANFFLFPQDVYVGTKEEAEPRNENEDEGNIFDIFADC